MTKSFPKFSSHNIVGCFNCGGDLDGSQWQSSGHPQGRGEFVQHCEKCRMSTWYDVPVSSKQQRRNQMEPSKL